MSPHTGRTRATVKGSGATRTRSPRLCVADHEHSACARYAVEKSHDAHVSVGKLHVGAAAREPAPVPFAGTPPLAVVSVTPENCVSGVSSAMSSAADCTSAVHESSVFVRGTGVVLSGNTGDVASRPALAAPPAAHVRASTAQPSVRFSAGMSRGHTNDVGAVSAATVSFVQLANKRSTLIVMGTGVTADRHTALTVTVEPPTAVTPNEGKRSGWSGAPPAVSSSEPVDTPVSTAGAHVPAPAAPVEPVPSGCAVSGGHTVLTTCSEQKIWLEPVMLSSGEAWLPSASTVCTAMTGDDDDGSA